VTATDANIAPIAKKGKTAKMATATVGASGSREKKFVFSDPSSVYSSQLQIWYCGC
jgi:hypothetical protein